MKVAFKFVVMFTERHSERAQKFDYLIVAWSLNFLVEV